MGVRIEFGVWVPTRPPLPPLPAIPRRHPRSAVLAHLTASPPPILHGSAITLTQFLLSRRAIPRVNQRLRNVLISASICRDISAGRKFNLLPLRIHRLLPIHFKNVIHVIHVLNNKVSYVRTSNYFRNTSQCKK